MSGSLYSYDPFKGEVITWKNLVLPMVTLGLRPLAIIVQLTRSAMLDVLGQDYIRTARAKGLGERYHYLPACLKKCAEPGDHGHRQLVCIPAGGFFFCGICVWI